jgi:exopolyphosphatase/pppGpp-phosphohydrolase
MVSLARVPGWRRVHLVTSLLYSPLLLVLIANASCSRANESRMPLCAIDMGSNTFRRIVATFDGDYRELALDTRRLGVGDDLLRHGTISDAKLTEIEQTLTAFRAGCVRDGATRIMAVGTAALREAPNSGAVVQRATALGIPVEIASEQRESELAYLAGSLGRPGFAVIDNGSRSIELVADDAGTIRYRVFNLGYRVAFDRFFAAAHDPAAAVATFRAELDKEAAQASFMKGKKKLVGVEFAEMAAVLFPPGEIEGRLFTRDQLHQRLNEITSLGASAFERLKQTEDIDRALPRLVVAAFLTEVFGYSQLELTRRELGAGLIIEAGQRER